MNSSSVDQSNARDVKSQRHAELQALLARVEAATGPDRALDRATVEALGLEYVGGENPGWWDAPDPEKPYAGDWRNARLTASLDAALALVERVLPGCERADVLAFPQHRSASAEVWPNEDDFFRATAATPPLALLAALLKALSAQSAGPAAGSVSHREEPK